MESSFSPESKQPKNYERNILCHLLKIYNWKIHEKAVTNFVHLVQSEVDKELLSSDFAFTLHFDVLSSSTIHFKEHLTELN